MLIYCADLCRYLPIAWHETPGIDNHNHHPRTRITCQYARDSRSSIFGTLILALSGGLLQAAQYTGSVRAADQPVPGAMVTAKQGDAKVIAYTDENGRYTMDLAPGAWDISVEMFEFTTSTGK